MLKRLCLLFTIVLSVFVFPVARGELNVSFEPGSSNKQGATKVEAANAKGQTFRLEKNGSIDGVSLLCHSVDEGGGDLHIKLFRTGKDGFPLGDPVFSDSGKLPSQKVENAKLRIDFEKPVSIGVGTYALVLETSTAAFRLGLNSDDDYTAGSLIRKNSSTKGTWKRGNGAKSDLIFSLLGDVDIQIGEGVDGKDEPLQIKP